MLNRSDTRSPWSWVLAPGEPSSDENSDPKARPATNKVAMGETPMVDATSGGWELAVRDRLLARDPSVLSDLYDQFGSYVFGLAARVIGDRHAAEDVTQDVFMSIWERPEAFEPARGRLRTFLGTLAHRRAVDVVRREEARRRRAARDAATACTDSRRRRARDGDRHRRASTSRGRPAARANSARRSSWRTSEGAPTGRSPRSWASRKEPRSRGCASA